MTQDPRAFNWDSIPVSNRTAADAAAGSDLPTVTVPAGKRWRLYAFRAALVASAVVGNRLVTAMIAPDGATALYQVASTTAHTAGFTRYYIWNLPKTYGETCVSPVYIMGFGVAVGYVELPAGATISFVTTALDPTAGTGDNWGAMIYTIKEAPA